MKIKLIIIVITLNSILIYSQTNPISKERVWLRLNNDNIELEKSLSNIKNGLLHKNSKSTPNIYRLFPHSKVKLLQEVYVVEFDKTNRLEILNKLYNNKNIKEIIELEEKVQIALYDPTDMWWSSTSVNPDGLLWHLNRIEADKAWDITKGDSSIKVAVIDTWFDLDHPDLVHKFEYNYDPYDNQFFYDDCQKNHHGTLVASFVGAETDGGGRLASVGFNTTIIGYQAWDGEYLSRAQHASLVEGVDIITSSAGGWSCNSTINNIEKLAVKEILDNGTIIVMPAGNGFKGTNCSAGGRERAFKPLSPEYDERIILVTSTGIDDKHYYEENGVNYTHSHYAEVDVCAPGYNVSGAISTEIYNPDSAKCVTHPYPPYYPWSKGTSFATPIVAGICALMKSIDPCLTPSEAQSIIKSTTDPVVDAESFLGKIGTGRVNAFEAVKKAGTQIIDGVIVSGTENWSAGYKFEVKNTQIKNGANVIIKARKEILINGNFEIQQGAILEIDIDNNAINCCL